jgi:hypothetical protein
VVLVLWQRASTLGWRSTLCAHSASRTCAPRPTAGRTPTRPQREGMTLSCSTRSSGHLVCIDSGDWHHARCGKVTRDRVIYVIVLYFTSAVIQPLHSLPGF